MIAPVCGMIFEKKMIAIASVCVVVEIPEAPEVRNERRSKGVETTELCGESLECSNSTMK
jgi:hypothetical protein